MLALTMPAPSSPERSRLLNVDALRRRALERLYERRAAVDGLIESLERYQCAVEGQRAPCIEFTALSK